MTIDEESAIARVEPFARKIYNATLSFLTFCWGSVLTLAGSGVAILAAIELRLPDAVLLLQNSRHPPPPVSDIRTALVGFVAGGVGVLIWGLHTLERHNWFQPHNQQAERVAELESQLREAEQFADEAAQSAAGAEWMRDTLAAVEHLFSIPGVLDAARKAARKALHPDGHPGVGPDEIRDLTEEFQMAESVFDRFSN
jgi:hypothetical protein